VKRKRCWTQPAHVFAALAERLGKRESDYAAIFHGLVALCGARPSAEEIAGVDENTPALDPESVDVEWEEAPVSFSASSVHDMGGPTGVVAKDQGGQPAGFKGDGAMNEFINQLAFGWYPYLAVTVLIVGSILRFDANQYSWRSQSSQFLRRRQMAFGSNLFHMGMLILFFGHLIGL
jgi:hypothetical protein